MYYIVVAVYGTCEYEPGVPMAYEGGYTTAVNAAIKEICQHNSDNMKGNLVRMQFVKIDKGL